MELFVVPRDLAGAAGAVRGVARSLDDALAAFAAVAHGCVPALGPAASSAAYDTWQQVAMAVDVMTTNIRTLAEGLAAVAEHYVDTDAVAVRVR